MGMELKEMPSLFTDKGYQLEFKLSTSQTPAVGTLGGGFAPLAKDGYGVSYVVSEDRLWFHISTYKISAEQRYLIPLDLNSLEGQYSLLRH